MKEKILAYLKGYKPDAVDAVLALVIVLYYFNLLPPDLTNEVANAKTALIALVFKNILPQRLDDITKRITGNKE